MNKIEKKFNMRNTIIWIIALLLLLTFGFLYLSTNKIVDDCDWISDYPVYEIKLGDTLEDVEQKHQLIKTTNDELLNFYDIRNILPSGCPITLWIYENKVVLIDIRTKDSSKKTYEKVLNGILGKFNIITQEKNEKGTMNEFFTVINGNEVIITAIYNKGVKQVFVSYSHRELMNTFNEALLKHMEK